MRRKDIKLASSRGNPIAKSIDYPRSRAAQAGIDKQNHDIYLQNQKRPGRMPKALLRKKF
jgi:hypothetical protein